MKNYLGLAKLHARHNSGQTRMTILCIILAVFLVTSVFSMVDFEYTHMKTKMIKDHGNWHILLNDVPKEEAEGIWEEVPVKAACWYDTFNYDLDKGVYLDGHPLCVVGTEPSFFDDMVINQLVEGNYPANGSEVLLNKNSKNMTGCAIGDTVVFQTPSGNYTYRVCGFVADTSNSLAEDAAIAVMDYSAFESLAASNGQQREPLYYIQLKSGLNTKSEIAELKASHGWTKENVSENTALLGITGMSTSNYVVGLYGVAAVLVLLVVLAGIFMISGSMNANVAERAQFFGMLRCIGAGKNQVRRIVRREALNWLKLALPIGVAASVIGCWIVCAVLAYGIGGEWEGMPVGKISVVGILLGALIGFVTVLLSANSPARRAAKVSPAAAVLGNQGTSFAGKSAKPGAIPIDISLGIHHAVSKKKSLLLLTGSFALSIILFLTCSVMIDWVDNALTTTKDYTPEISVYRDGFEPVLSHELADELRGTDGVKYAYGRMHVSSAVLSDTGVSQIDLISYDDIQFQWAEKDLLRGGNIEKVKNEIGSVIVVYDKDRPLCVGDTFVMNGKTLNVDAVLSDSPFEITEVPAVICSEQTFRIFAGNMDYSVIDLQLEKGAGDETVAQIRSLLGDGIFLSDRRASIIETNSTYLAFSVLVYAFLAIVALIASLNIINSISMSVTARRRQFGMMRATGLEKGQLLRMITAESLTYAVSGCFAGCLIGLPVNAWFYKVAITNYWGTPWGVPVTELLIIFAVVFCSALIAVRAPAKRLSESSVVETMNL